MKWDGDLRLLLYVHISWVQKGQTSKAEMIKGSLREETWDIQVKKDSFVLKYLLKCESTLHPVEYKYKKAKFNDCEVIQKIGKEQ